MAALHQPGRRGAARACPTRAARAAVTKIKDPAPATLELVKPSLACNQLTTAEQGKAVRRSPEGRHQLNPRYGKFDPQEVQLRRRHAQLDQGRAPGAAPRDAAGLTGRCPGG